MKCYFVLIAFLVPSVDIVAASAWANPSERYTDAYRAYLGAKCPVGSDTIKHFVYLSRDRERLHDHAFLKNARFAGAQIMYAWNQLERTKGEYDFTIVEDDLRYLRSKNKALFIQLQDATFNPKYRAVPDYLLGDEYDGGAVRQREDGGDDGWVAKRWNNAVQQRFAALLQALGERFDGRIEGINLQETAIGVTRELDNSFTPETYVAGIKVNLVALKKAFPKSTTMQYANFMPGEWLPWEDKGYLRGIYAFAEQIGVGVGAPDLMVHKKGHDARARILRASRHRCPRWKLHRPDELLDNRDPTPELGSSPARIRRGLLAGRLHVLGRSVALLRGRPVAVLRIKALTGSSTCPRESV